MLSILNYQQNCDGSHPGTAILMQAYACGYLGQHLDTSTSFRALSGSEAQTSLVPGGWGYFGLVSDGSLHLHAAQPRVSQQQLT